MKVAIITTFAHKAYKARKELINEIKSKNCKVTIMGPEEESLCLPELSKQEIEYVQLNLERRNLDPFSEISALNNTKNKFVDNKIDCVVVYGIRMIPSVVLAAKLAKVKHIVCIVNGAGNLLMSKGIKGKLLKVVSFPMLLLAFNNANEIIFQNRDDFKDLKKQYLISDKNVNFTNGSGVNIDIYKHTPLPEKLEFLLVSRITGSKGINEYVEAAKIVKKKYPWAQFKIVGPKDDNDGSVDWTNIKNAEEESIVKYCGESNEVINYLNDCRVYVFPSYYREGVPRSVLEAMSVGRPIITTNTPGNRETVVNGVNGFLIPPKDIAALAQKMMWMIENGDEVEKMGRKSRELCEEKFDVRKINAFVVEKMKL